MAKKSKRYTLVLIRETEHPIRQLRLKAWQLKAGLGAAAVLLLILLVLGTQGLLRSGSELQLRTARAENARLREDVKRIHARMTRLEGTLREIDDFQRWTRTVAKLEPLGEEALAGGVGGPSSLRPTGELAGIDRRLDRLSGRSQVLRQSAESVLSALRADEKRLRSIPSIHPVSGGRLTSGFGHRIDPFTGRLSHHDGLDFSARTGTPIVSTADGTVLSVEHSATGYGSVLVVDHGEGLQTRYAHCDRILVLPGQKVLRGEVVATVGSSGHSTAPHLHYEVHRHGELGDPLGYILSDEFVVD
ncbi:M23 family metallopeptidase [bacterium]|nr:M23 family metallopeptidase [bacterium]